MKSAIAVPVLIASLMFASAAVAAETVVPPGNSSVTQYTEAFPTAGGNAKSNTPLGGGGGKGKTPTQVLGSKNAQKLESKGPVGEEVATLSAETAPVSATPTGGGGNTHAAGNGGANNASHAGGKPAGSTGGGEGNAASGPRPAGSTASDTASGSSGLGEVLGQATGSSSGELGLFLPLILIGTVVWSLYYLRRERRQVP